MLKFSMYLAASTSDGYSLSSDIPNPNFYLRKYHTPEKLGNGLVLKSERGKVL